MPTASDDNRPARGDLPFEQELPALLAARGLSLRAIAAAAGVSPSHLSRALRGADRKSASAKLIEAVAAALGLPSDHFPETREAYVVERIRNDPVLRDRLFDELT